MTKQRLNILIVASRSDIAGGENYLLSVFRYMDMSRFRPIVWLPGDGAFRAALDDAGIECVIDSVVYGWLKPPKPWYDFLSGLSGRVRRIVNLIRDRDIQIVHTNSNMILEGALAARLAGVRHLFLAHIDFQSNLPIYQRLPLDPHSFARLMDDLSVGILAVSDYVRNTLCPPLSPARITVVNNGLELARFDSALAESARNLRSSLGLSDTAVVVLAAGRVTEDKGFDLLIEAAGQLVSKHPLAVFLICGSVDSRDYQEELLSRIEKLGLAEKIRLLGRRNDLPNLMAQSDLFVLSSRREGHPYVLLEAMACNLPAVATRCGGVEETVVDGETGFSVPIGDVPALAERISMLLEDAGLRHRMGLAAGRRVRMHFTAKQSAEGLFQMYEQILTRPAPESGAYSVDLLLQAAAEYGYLGERLTLLEERMKKAERAAEMLLDNPVTRLMRRIKKH